MARGGSGGLGLLKCRDLCCNNFKCGQHGCTARGRWGEGGSVLLEGCYESTGVHGSSFCSDLVVEAPCRHPRKCRRYLLQGRRKATEERRGQDNGEQRTFHYTFLSLRH